MLKNLYECASFSSPHFPQTFFFLWNKFAGQEQALNPTSPVNICLTLSEELPLPPLCSHKQHSLLG